MKKAHRRLVAAGAVIAFVCVGYAGAQRLSAMPDRAGAQGKGVHSVAGGVGADARAEMLGLATSHTLLIKFAGTDGAYLLPDYVAIRKGNAQVLQMTDAGPLLYVNLPNGVYTVVARYKGVVRSKTVSAGGRLTDVLLTWPLQAQAE